MTLQLSLKDCGLHHQQSGQEEVFCHTARPVEGVLSLYFITEIAQYAGIYLDSLMDLFAFFNAFPHLLYFHVPGISIKNQTGCKLDKCVMP